MLRPEFVERKLQLIADDLGQLSVFRDDRYEDLISDPIRMAAVERILERMVLRAIDVNTHLLSELSTGEEERTTRLTYRETFERLADLGVYSAPFGRAIGASAGLRNVLVHEYNDIDHRIVHGSIRTALEQYADYVDAVRAFLENR